MNNKKIQEQFVELLLDLLATTDKIDLPIMANSFMTALYVNQKYSKSKKISFEISDGENCINVHLETNENGELQCSLNKDCELD